MHFILKLQKSLYPAFNSWLWIIVLITFACETVLLTRQQKRDLWVIRLHSRLPQHGVHGALLRRVHAQDHRLWTKGTINHCEAQLSQRDRATLCQLKSYQLMHGSRKNNIWKDLKMLAVGEWPWRSLKVIGIIAIRWTVCHFLLVVCSNNDSIFHRFWDITTFTVYVTVCDLEKSFSRAVPLR